MNNNEKLLWLFELENNNEKLTHMITLTQYTIINNNKYVNNMSCTSSCIVIARQLVIIDVNFYFFLLMNIIFHETISINIRFAIIFNHINISKSQTKQSQSLTSNHVCLVSCLCIFKLVILCSWTCRVLTMLSANLGTELGQNKSCFMPQLILVLTPTVDFFFRKSGENKGYSCNWKRCSIIIWNSYRVKNPCYWPTQFLTICIKQLL